MKQITVRDEFGNPYNLHFTAKTVEIMERQGFDINKIDSMPQTMVRLLWNGSFLADHKNTTDVQRDKIYESLANKEGLIAKLLELYEEPMVGLLNEGNVEWEANF